MIPAAVITVSDRCYRDERKDDSGPAVALELEKGGFRVVLERVTPDEVRSIRSALREGLANARLVVTVGGTGIGPRDVTPEATRPLCDRTLDGVAELMRAEGLRETKFAALSRCYCGTTGQSILLNLPGSPKGAVTSLKAVLSLMPHALKVLAGETQHDDAPGA